MSKKDKDKKLEDSQLVAQIDAQLKYVQDYRWENEKVWWQIMNFIKGKHYFILRSIASDRTVEFKPVTRKKGQVVRTFNFFRKVYKDLKSMITVANYRWSVIGGDAENNTEEKYLSWFFKTNGMATKISKVAGFGFKREKGYMEIYWDGKKPACNPIDPFLLYNDPHGEFWLKIIVKRMSELKEAMRIDEDKEVPVYNNLDKISPSKNKSFSKLYNQYQQAEHQSVTPKEDDKGITEYLLLERYTMEDGFVRIVTKEGGTIIRDEITNMTEHIFEEYTAESDDDADPILKPVLDAAKALNRTCNMIESYIKVFCKGRYYVKTGQKFTETTNKIGQVLQYDLRKPEAEVLQALPPTVNQYKEDMIVFHELLSGANIQPPSPSASGKALAFRQALQQQNMIEPMANMKDFLVRVGMKILRLVDTKLAEGTPIYWKEGLLNEDAKVVGATAGKGLNEDSDTLKIKTPLNLEVEILPGGAFDRLNQKEDVKEMWRDKAIDIETYHEIMAIGNLGDIMKRMKKIQREEADQALLESTAGGGRGGAPSVKKVKPSRAGAFPASIPQRSPQQVVRAGVTEALPGKIPIKKPVV